MNKTNGIHSIFSKKVWTSITSCRKQKSKKIFLNQNSTLDKLSNDTRLNSLLRIYRPRPNRLNKKIPFEYLAKTVWTKKLSLDLAAGGLKQAKVLFWSCWTCVSADNFLSSHVCAQKERFLALYMLGGTVYIWLCVYYVTWIRGWAVYHCDKMNLTSGVVWLHIIMKSKNSSA